MRPLTGWLPMSLARPHELPAWQAARLLARRELSAVDLLRACLARIEEREPEVRAFAHLDAQAAFAQAQAPGPGAARCTACRWV
jgi:Asp-tRNA(Asn)/Glu-tRNA(Gln) amidotransferase A subunit family amidase